VKRLGGALCDQLAEVLDGAKVGKSEVADRAAEASAAWQQAGVLPRPNPRIWWAVPSASSPAEIVHH